MLLGNRDSWISSILAVECKLHCSLSSTSRWVRCSSVPRSTLSSSMLDGKSFEELKTCVQACNRGHDRRSEFLPFKVEDHKVGYIHPSFAEHLRSFPETFTLKSDSIQLHASLKTPDQRTAAVDEVLLSLRDDGLIPGWRDERYPVLLHLHSPPLFSLERSAVPFFGTKAYGVHMNGYVLNDGTKKLWVAKRSSTKQTYPGFLDHLVAGGQPVGLSCEETIVKECEEEAGIPKALAQRATPVGAVSYEDIHNEVYNRAVLFCYDLELPPDFEPRNADGEVESFGLESIPRVVQSLKLYKPNCALVVIDFLFRHGYITPEHQGYMELLHSLRTAE